VTDQPGQEPGSGGSGPGTNPMAPVPPERQQGAGERGGWRSLWLAGGALLVMFFAPPVALAFAVAALIVGIRARRRARRSQTMAPGAVAGVVMGGIGLGLSALLVVMQIIFWPELKSYLSCREASNTISDQQHCKETLFRDVERKLDLPQGSLKRYDLPI
jgi:hypothetical protein